MNTVTAVSTSLRLPDFVCIGAAKCGSTTLWEMLGRHERIFMPQLKELHFFDNFEDRFDAGLESYAAHFKDAAADCLIGESTPSYIFIPEACDRLRAALPDARLIAILRNPVDRAWSNYWFTCKAGLEPLGFDEAVEAEPARREAGLHESLRFSYIARGHYVHQLKRYEQTFSREQLCVVFFEEFVKDPKATIDLIYQHLDLETPDDPEAYVMPWHHKQTTYYRWPRVHATANGVGKWASTDNSVVRRAARKIVKFVDRQTEVKGKPKMTEAQRNRLETIFHDSNAELEQWLGRPLPWS